MKKYLIILTIIFIVFSSTSFAQKYYPDVVNTKYYEPVEMMAEFEILSEYEDSYFHPERTIDRASFAESLVMLLRRMEILPESLEEAPYEDVPIDHWASAYIEDVKNRGVMKVREGNRFCP